MEVKSLQQMLKERGEAIIRTAGISMEPLLHAGESTVLIQRKDRPCRKNDVALFIRPDGQYVLHRVIGLGKQLRMRGDHQLVCEWVDEECVIGLMVGFHARRNSKFCSIRSVRYAAYLLVLPVLRLHLRMRVFGGRVRCKWREMIR